MITSSAASQRSESWEELRLRKLAARDAILEHHAGISSSQRRTQPEGSAQDLLNLLSTGRLSAEKAVASAIDAAIEAHRKTNCITEPLFSQARQQAASQDLFLAETGRPIGPLHGLPISLKDQFDVHGVDSTLGWSCLIDRPAKHDCVLVHILKAAGAIPFVKTNLPQTIMFAETENPVFGVTTHPMKSGYSPGGSSGGEAALIASGATFLGWGTDLGGSIRMPAHLCGLYGLRPSHGRLPYHDVSVTQFGNETVPSVVGPLSSDLDLLELAVKAVIDAEPWRMDPKCLPIPWRIVEPIARMKIGVLWDDGVVAPLPPIARALRDTVQDLVAAGHEIIDWEPDLHAEIVKVMDDLFVIDKGADFRDFLMPGEPVMDRVQKMMAKGRSEKYAGTVHELWRLHQRKGRLQKAYLDRMEANKVDFLLTPVMPTVASPVYKHCWWVGYTKFVNLLDLTAMVFPMTRVSQDLDTLAELERPYRNDFERDAWAQWNVTEMQGLPVGLQLVGKRLEEEKVLMVTKQIVQLCEKS